MSKGRARRGNVQEEGDPRTGPEKIEELKENVDQPSGAPEMSTVARSLGYLIGNRKSELDEPSWQELVNLIWCVIPLGALVSLLTCVFFLYSRSEEERVVASYEAFVWITLCAVWIEFLSEPFWIMMQMLFLIKQRVAMEAAAMIARCVAVFVGVFCFQMELLSFAFAQVIYSVILFAGFLVYFKREIDQQSSSKSSTFPFRSLRDAFPRVSSWGVSAASKRAGMLVLSFSWQSLEKMLLQESEKIVLKFADSLLHQGVFSVVSNLGSLVARFLFQPVEEVSFTLFSKLLKSDQAKERQTNMVLASRVLYAILKLMVLIGLVFTCFGTNYSTSLLEILYGQKYGRESPAPPVLVCYCVFVFFMALNGVTEAFFSAAASPRDLRYHNIAMIGFSCVYIVACVLLVHRFDTSGLVAANCINMMVRISYSLLFTRRYFAATSCQGLASLPSAFPRLPVTIIFVLSFVVTFLSEQYLYLSRPFGIVPLVLHIGVGCVCLACTVAVGYLTERQFLSDLKQLRDTKRKTQ